jgi:type IV secretion system protein VirB6
MHFITDFFTIIDAILNTFITDTTMKVTTEITPVVSTIVSIYIMFWGWSMIRGMIQEPIMDGVSRMLKISFIASLVIGTGNYNLFISDWLWHFPDALGGLITGNNNPVSSVNFLDELATQFFEKGKFFWDKGGTTALDYSILAIIIFMFGGALILYAMGLLLIAKVGITIFLGIGQIFILMLMFDSTRKFFDAWIGQVLNFAFVPMLTAGVVSLVLAALQAYMTKISNGSTELVDFFCLIVVCGASLMALAQVPSWASQLGGGVATSTMGVGKWAANKAMGAAGAGAKGAAGLGYRGAKAGYQKVMNSGSNSISGK